MLLTGTPPPGATPRSSNPTPPTPIHQEQQSDATRTADATNTNESNSKSQKTLSTPSNTQFPKNTISNFSPFNINIRYQCLYKEPGSCRSYRESNPGIHDESHLSLGVVGSRMVVRRNDMSLLNKITQSWVDAEKERVDVLTRFDSTDYRPACSVCGKDFTESEWNNRHTDPSDNLSDCHAVCCSECEDKK